MVVLGPSGAVDQQLGRLDLVGQVGDHKLGILEGRQRLSKLLTHLRIGNRFVQSAFGNARACAAIPMRPRPECALLP